MYLDVLVEEESAEIAINILAPKLLPHEIEFGIFSYGGKERLLRKRPRRLQTYRRIEEYRIAVLVDVDRDDCRLLKNSLETMAREALLTTPTTAQPNSPVRLINRLAVEELEAWFFGDVEALAYAYPGVDIHLGRQAAFRNPDQIRGGTAEALLRVLQRSGYYNGLRRLPKLEVAERVAQHMRPERNQSPSFRCFCTGLLNLLQTSKQ